MKPNLLSLSCALLLASGLAKVATASDWSLGGNLALTSDYLFRGFTQTDARPAIQGGLDLTHASGFLAGVWGSNVESDPDAAVNFDGASQELDISLGWNGKLGGSGLEATVKAARYFYPGTRFDPYNTNEFSLYLAYDFGPARVKGGVYYSDDYAGQGEATYWDSEVAVPIGPATLVLHYGGQGYKDPAVDDYEDYKIGLAGEAAGLGLDLSYYGTRGVADYDCNSHTCGERFVFTLSKSF
ncbi:MAG: TorF family putative porin [Gammaproteobacteria bacterium]|nr:TorF family putative porin [Gammaproteobacteria bacterium]MBU1654368.1 TorF family putative porin [Gammaproteobacteria bacterium]MBU1961995.1 TorF family putative porin [Gammaproteobacteria bacterium]